MGKCAIDANLFACASRNQHANGDEWDNSERRATSKTGIAEGARDGAVWREGSCAHVRGGARDQSGALMAADSGGTKRGRGGAGDIADIGDFQI